MPPTIGTAEGVFGSGKKRNSVLSSSLAMDWKYNALSSGRSAFHLGSIAKSVLALEANLGSWVAE